MPFGRLGYDPAVSDASPLIALEPAYRTVTADDGERITLTIYRDGEAVAVLALISVQAMRLADRLLDAGLRHLRDRDRERGSGP